MDDRKGVDKEQCIVNSSWIVLKFRSIKQKWPKFKLPQKKFWKKIGFISMVDDGKFVNHVNLPWDVVKPTLIQFPTALIVHRARLRSNSCWKTTHIWRMPQAQLVDGDRVAGRDRNYRVFCSSWNAVEDRLKTGASGVLPRNDVHRVIASRRNNLIKVNNRLQSNAEMARRIVDCLTGVHFIPQSNLPSSQTASALGHSSFAHHASIYHRGKPVGFLSFNGLPIFDSFGLLFHSFFGCCHFLPFSIFHQTQFLHPTCWTLSLQSGFMFKPDPVAGFSSAPMPGLASRVFRCIRQ